MKKKDSKFQKRGSVTS